MHKLRLYTEPSFITKKSKSFEVKVLFKAVASEEYKDVLPNSVAEEPGAIFVTIPFNTYPKEHMLAEAELIASMAAVSGRAAEAFKTKKSKGPRIIGLEVTYSQKLAYDLQLENLKPSTMGDHSNPFRKAYKFAGAFLLGADYALDESQPEWLETAPYINYQTSTKEFIVSHSVNTDYGNFIPWKRIVISYLAFESAQKSEILRPYMALSNYLLKQAKENNIHKEKMVNDGREESREFEKDYYQVIAGFCKMITARMIGEEDRLEQIIELNQFLSADTYEEYSQRYEQRLAVLNLRFNHKQLK